MSIWALVVFTCLDMNVCPVRKTYFQSEEECIQAMFHVPSDSDYPLSTYFCVPQVQDINYDGRLRDKSGRLNAD